MSHPGDLAPVLPPYSLSSMPDIDQQHHLPLPRGLNQWGIHHPTAMMQGDLPPLAAGEMQPGMGLEDMALAMQQEALEPLQMQMPQLMLGNESKDIKDHRGNPVRGCTRKWVQSLLAVCCQTWSHRQDIGYCRSASLECRLSCPRGSRSTTATATARTTTARSFCGFVISWTMSGEPQAEYCRQGRRIAVSCLPSPRPGQSGMHSND